MSDQVLEEATGPERVSQDGQGGHKLRGGSEMQSPEKPGRESWWVLWSEKRGP